MRHWPFPQESHSGVGNFYFTSTGFNCNPLEWDFCRYLFMCMFDTKQDECCFNDQLNSFLRQIWLWDVSYGAIYVNCLDLISQNFQYPVLEAVFPNDYLLDFGHLMLLLVMISRIAFEPLLVVQTACAVCFGEKLTIFKHGNMRRRLSSLLEMYARKSWSLCYTALSNCYGI